MDESNPDDGRAESTTATRRVRSYAEVTKETKSGLLEQVLAQRERLAVRLAGVAAVVGVVSGKGGVGKSAVSANLAVTLAGRGARVGAVDADLNGPCLARMLGVLGHELEDTAEGVVPATNRAGVKVMSTELLLDENIPLRWKGPQGDSYIWQGTSEAAVLREFLSDVQWGELDYLVVDVPPGTDKIGRFLDLVPEPHQVLLVTIPSPVAVAVVARAATLLGDAGVRTIGIVGNMTAYTPANTEAPLPLFSNSGLESFANVMDLPIWGEVPFDPDLCGLTDGGTPPGAAHSGAVGRAFEALADRVEAGPGGRKQVR